MNANAQTIPDYLSEVMLKLKNGGLMKAELTTTYMDKTVAPGVTVWEYIKLLGIDGAIQEKADRFELIPQ